MLEWFVHERAGLAFTAYFLDDFLFMDRADSWQCSHLLAICQSLCNELDVLLAPTKMEFPASTFTSLGVELIGQWLIVVVCPSISLRLKELLRESLMSHLPADPA